MSENATTARPYARAAFETARDAGSLDTWSSALASLAELTTMPEVQRLVAQPGIDTARVAEVFCEAAGAKSGPLANFVRLLASNQRLLVLPAIADTFEVLRRDHEQVAEVTITTAVAVEGPQREALSTAVQNRLGRKADIHWAVDDAVIAGARIRAGDQVVDASVAHQIEQLREFLNA